MLKEKIIAYAKSIGFDLVGFSSAEANKENLKFYKSWLEEKRHGEMAYLEKITPRKNLQKILPGAKTVISLGMNYYHEQKPLKKGFGRIARYAYGRDYHKIIGKKLKQVEEFIKTLEPKACLPCLAGRRAVGMAETKSYVDTGPILERSFAEKSGLGKVGKNSCLITKEFGSWVFLAEIITNLEIVNRQAGQIFSKKLCRNFESGLQTDEKFARSYTLDRANLATVLEKTSAQPEFPLCGSCTRCIDSCPTQAIIAPGVIDARKCISYLTIENKKQIPRKFHEAIKKSGRLFGCDICQEVCPHNCRARHASPGAHSSCPRAPLLPLSIPSRANSPSLLSWANFYTADNQLNLKKILSIKTDQEFLKTFAGSPLMRAKRKGLQRNAKCLL